jgi:mono/diheme cytochrome c family protein
LQGWLLGAALLGGCSGMIYREGRSHLFDEMPEAKPGPAMLFAYDDFRGLSTDTLNTTAVPWKLTATALVLDRYPSEAPTQAHLRELMQSFGFVYPDRIVNGGLMPDNGLRPPLGLVAGQVHSGFPRMQLEVANIGCASCHGGRLYDAEGRPTDEVWLGLPNSSLDLDAYADAVVRSLSALDEDPQPVLDAMRHLYPDVPAEEIESLRRTVWPRLRKRLPELQATGAVPFRNGGPGRSNGVEAMKFSLGIDGDGGVAAATGFPALSSDLKLRSSLLVDGFYALPDTAKRFAPRQRDAASTAVPLANIAGFFVVSAMGVEPKRIPELLPRTREIMAWLDETPTPVFPGPIDEPKAQRGAGLFADHCSSCHGQYVETEGRPQLQRYPNKLVPMARIGTDPGRARAVTTEAVWHMQRSVLGDDLRPKAHDGYVAPSLSGIWATAPYLHNGSVPTLWHMMRPESRPRRFQVGGHALDYRTVGIAGQPDARQDWHYPDGYRPWSTPQWLDTREAGNGNGGHERPFDELTEPQKDDLLEYLKRL